MIYVAPRPSAAASYKAGPLGPGAGVLLTEFPLSINAQTSPQRKMRRALDLGISVPWIRAAERVIAGRFASVSWHLEDANDATITDESTDQEAVTALDLLEKPQLHVAIGTRLTRSKLWKMTCRDMGLAGNSFWYLDQTEEYAGTPASILYIRPDRMTPIEDKNGNLLGWLIDYSGQPGSGIGVRPDQVIQFVLEPPFVGHFGIGLVESALLKLQLSTALDQHLGQVLSAGGRISGIMSPKTGVAAPEDFAQLERDWRTVVEQPDAAKRLQLVRAPVDFIQTTMSPQELQVRTLMEGARDDLLGLWGVPLTMIGGVTPSGLNGGDAKKHDEMSLWRGPVHDRLTTFRESVQFELLDRWQARGTTLELIIEEPAFDEDSPRYDLLAKSINTPLTNEQRLAIIGLPPTGDPAIDRQIMLPATLVPYAMAPVDPPGQTPTEQALGRSADDVFGEPDEATLAAGEQSDGQALVGRIEGSGRTNGAITRAANTAGPPAAKARDPYISPNVKPLHDSLTKFRANVDRAVTPRVQSSVSSFLAEQGHDIAARLRTHAEHVRRKPGDSSVWWNGDAWDRELTSTLAPHVGMIAEQVAGQVNDVLPSKRP